MRIMISGTDFRMFAFEDQPAGGHVQQMLDTGKGETTIVNKMFNPFDLAYFEGAE